MNEETEESTLTSCELCAMCKNMILLHDCAKAVRLIKGADILDSSDVIYRVDWMHHGAWYTYATKNSALAEFVYKIIGEEHMTKDEVTRVYGELV